VRNTYACEDHKNFGPEGGRLDLPSAVLEPIRSDFEQHPNEEEARRRDHDLSKTTSVLFQKEFVSTKIEYGTSKTAQGREGMEETVGS